MPARRCMMYEYHILKQLAKYSGARKDFHVPGHKAKGDFKVKFPIAPLDVTELEWSDNLACPAGIIAAAQEDIAKITGAKHSYILTDGSSSGVLTMMYAASLYGNKIIVPRNCHQSVWNACRLFGLEPVIVQGENRAGLITPVSPEAVEQLIVNDINISGMIVTSPDYYGVISPLKEYSEVLKKHGRFLFVDGAHGAHLAFENDKAGYAGAYADVWVDGAHKSLPTLTQGAVLNVAEEKLIAAVEDGLIFFRTTSPSYPIMASVEYGYKYVANNPEIYARAKAAAETFKNEKKLRLFPSDDWTKIVVDCEPSGVSSEAVVALLAKKGVYPELNDGRYIVFYLSPMTTIGDVGDLKKLLLSAFANKKIAKSYKPRPAIPQAARTYSFQYALKRPSEWVEPREAIGRMCAMNVGLTPPCIPVIAAGEMVTEAAVKVLLSGTAYGMADGKIKVVKK